MAKRLAKIGLSATISALALIVVQAHAVLADPRDFTLENDSLSYIIHLYVSPSSSTSWGEDILGVDVLPPGQSVDITFDTNIGRTCIYDILVETEDGSPTRTNHDSICTTSPH